VSQLITPFFFYILKIGILCPISRSKYGGQNKYNNDEWKKEKIL